MCVATTPLFCSYDTALQPGTPAASWTGRTGRIKPVVVSCSYGTRDPAPFSFSTRRKDVVEKANGVLSAGPNIALAEGYGLCRSDRFNLLPSLFYLSKSLSYIVGDIKRWYNYYIVNRIINSLQIQEPIFSGLSNTKETYYSRCYYSYY